MARKSIGYVKLEWVCPNCNTRNPGPQKTCLACGNPQPADVLFIKADQDELITDEKELEQAKSGADVHCPYCGTRNPGSAKICTQCGGDLSGAQVRQSGQTLGAFQDKAVSVTCPNCGTENPSFASFCISCGAPLAAKKTAVQPPAAPSFVDASAKRKLNPLLIILPAALLVLIVIILVLANKKTDISAVVMDTYWQRSITIQEYGPVTHSDWISNIPEGAQLGQCESVYHHTSDQPEPSSTEVCGTPYVVDRGSGYGETVTDCVYEVFEDRCEYTSDEWYTLTTLSLDGSDQSPLWPETSLTANQREGSRNEQYTITFGEGSKTYTYTTDSYSEFQELSPGSTWLISVNTFGKITDLQPVN